MYDDAYAHPAKGSPKLFDRILGHLEALGLLRPNDVVLDPMGGTGITAMLAGLRGYRAVTVELEERFVGFQRENKARLERKTGRALDWTILEGDARRLPALLAERGLVAVTSPPYFDSGADVGGAGATPSGRQQIHDSKPRKDGYGTTPGQIGALPDRPMKAVLSPPYASVPDHVGSGVDLGKNYETYRASGGGSSFEKFVASRQKHHDDYGTTPGQIGALPDRPLRIVTSPPYEGHVSASDSDLHPERQVSAPAGRQYGTTDGQLAGAPDYLSAMAQVYAACAQVADVIAVVVKDPTKGGKLRLLDQDTQALLEATGWRIHCRHEALLFETQEQGSLFGEPERKVKGRLSFFKRLSMAKGSPVADREHIIIGVSPT